LKNRFDDLTKEEQEQKKFRENFQKSNIFTRFYYSFGDKFVNDVYHNNSKMTDEMIENMCLNDDDDRKRVDEFFAQLDRRYQDWLKLNPDAKRPDAPWYRFVRNTIFSMYAWVFWKATFFLLIGEMSQMAYTYCLVFMIRWIEDPDGTTMTGVKIAAIFIGLTLAATSFRNYFMFIGYNACIDLRKLVIATLYHRVTQLTLKAMTETNGAKLISLVSTDFFMFERPLQLVPMLVVAPILNIIVYILIGVTSRWEYSLMIFVLWVLTLFSQSLASKWQKVMQLKMAKANDERMKLVNDMITGIRTIKSYAWENHYLKKVDAAREKQTGYVFILNMVSMIGFTLFQNIGLLAVLAIYVYQWQMGWKIELSESMALLAMIFLLFFSTNSMAYFGTITFS
jgi:ABC-type multidrug transport system fused ATPase/permease subunit